MSSALLGFTELSSLSAPQVPLYTAEIVERYVNRGTPRDGSQAPEPHVFLTADTAYRAMARNNASQSLVITGESGSGKTETTKIAMQVRLSADSHGPTGSLHAQLGSHFTGHRRAEGGAWQPAEQHHPDIIRAVRVC